MKLADLQPQFIRYEERIETWQVVDGDPETWHERGCPTKDKTGPRIYHVNVDTLQQAQGIMFLCPKCFHDNGDTDVGTHWVDVTFEGRGVADNQGCHGDNGAPTRWGVSGTGYADLSTTPSILLIGGCGWHGFITNGDVTS